MAHIKLSRRISLSMLLCLLCSLVSCSTQTDKESFRPQGDQEEFVYHRVKYSGETYQIISNWYTKSSKNTSLLIELNPAIKPTRIKIGDLIKIPKRLLARPKSLPQDYVGSFSTVKNTPTQANSDPVPTIKDSASNLNQENNSLETVAVTDSSDRQVSPKESERVIPEPEIQTIEQEEPSVATLEEVPVQPQLQAEVPAATEDPNSKIREKLMKELLE